MKPLFDNPPDDHGWSHSTPESCLQTPIFEVIQATVTSRLGRQRQFYRFNFPGWVNVIALTPEKHLVLIRQYRFGTNRTEIEIPGGAIDKDEDPVTAGQRELREETGLTGTNAIIIGQVCPNPALQNNRCYTVLIENVQRQGAQRLDEMEDIEVATASLDQVVAMVRGGEIHHGLVLNALMYYTLWLQGTLLAESDCP